VRHKIDMHQHAIIISNRRQWKFGSDYNKLPSCVLKLVRGLEEDVFKCCGTQDICLHDCYAITTPSDDNSIEGRGPQPWHLDSFFSFPQAVCLLSGGSLTEFAAGCYTDFSEEFQAAKAKGFPWSHNAAGRFRDNITSKYNLDSRCWNQGYGTDHEQVHWQNHLNRAGLLQEDNVEVEMGRISVAVAGDACVFWSNKLHRGPPTLVGQERIALFMSWVPIGVTSARSQKSYTDQTWRLDPHLRQKYICPLGRRPQ
jgi:hypothetical protein